MFVTARVAKRVKVMFSQACVTHSVQLGWRWSEVNHLPNQGQWSTTSLPHQGRRSTTSPSRCRGQPPPNSVRGQPPPPGSEVNHLPPGSDVNHLPPPPGYIWELWSMGGRYASYWNAFLFQLFFNLHRSDSIQGTDYVTDDRIVPFSSILCFLLQNLKRLFNKYILYLTFEKTCDIIDIKT